MNYQQLIEKIYSLNSSFKSGLNNIQLLTNLFNHPEKKFKSIHVAGTNGKGSVATKIAAALEYSGYKTGLFTSPHIQSYCERISINGVMIPEDQVVKLLNQIFFVIEKEKIQATFFEVTTLLAFTYFSEKKVDFAVFETGIGGRLDATNVLDPELAIITSISLDHTDILGHTIESIAQEKAGIIKPGKPIVIGPSVPNKIINPIANLNNSQLFQESSSFKNFDEENSAIAKLALFELAKKFPIHNKAMIDGLKEKPPCRIERIEGNPTIILDVAHNPAGLKALFEAINSRPLRILFGLSKNKDLELCLDQIVKYGKEFHLIEAKNERAAPIELLTKGLLERGVHPKNINLEKEIEGAFLSSRKLAAENKETLVVCGSFFIMAPILDTLKRIQLRP